ncbi:MAG: DUF5126 domain-containing protein, partial [Odoribacteraceae bacterium]|nr:DUF5126 domain-containing protein [Odoribacteraceae bacterium]
SRYVDSLLITTLATSDERNVALYAVDNSNNLSEPVVVSVTPGQSHIYAIVESITAEPYSGGIRLTWDNPNRVDMAVEVLLQDSTENYVTYATFTGNASEGIGVKFTGLEPVRSYFGVYVRDRWGNRTPVKYYTIVPKPYLIRPYLADRTSFPVPQFFDHPLYMDMSELTYEVWVRRREPQSFIVSTIMGIDDPKSMLLCIYDNGVGAYAGTWLWGPRAELETWYHIAFVYDGSMLRLYVNGKQEASAPRSGYIDISIKYPGDPAFMIGQSIGARYFDGEMNDIRVWSVARTQDQIRANMFGAVDPSTPGLIANWRFDDGEGTVIRDYSPNGYDITASEPFEWVLAPTTPASLEEFDE